MRNGRYALIHLHRQRIGTEIGTEIERWREAIHPDAYLSVLSGVCRLSVHFGCLGCLEFVGSDFLTSIKKFFNFPKFFF